MQPKKASKAVQKRTVASKESRPNEHMSKKKNLSKWAVKDGTGKCGGVYKRTDGKEAERNEHEWEKSQK